MSGAKANRAAPIRTCVGCGGRDLQSSLVRFGFGRGPGLLRRAGGCGRTAYLHARQACLLASAKGRLMERSLRRPVSSEMRESLASIIGLVRA